MIISAYLKHSAPLVLLGSVHFINVSLHFGTKYSMRMIKTARMIINCTYNKDRQSDRYVDTLIDEVSH